MDIQSTTTTLLLILLTIVVIILAIMIKRKNTDFSDGGKSGQGVEVPNDIENDLLNSGSGAASAFYTKGNTQISTNKWFVSLYDLVSMLKSAADVEGFYIYPAVYNLAAISIDYILVIVRPNPANNVYYRLDKNYEYGPMKPVVISLVDAQEGFNNYYNEIKSVEHVSYASEKQRPSRFYETMEFFQFLRRQGLKPLDPDINNLKNYKLYIKGAAVLDPLAQEINKYWKTEVPSGHTYHIQIGFTAFMYLTKTDNTRLGNALEIGKPCPPRCGELSW